MEATTPGVTWRYLLLFVAGRYKGAIHINRFRPSIHRASFSFVHSSHKTFMLLYTVYLDKSFIAYCSNLVMSHLWGQSQIACTKVYHAFSDKDVIKVLEDLKRGDNLLNVKNNWKLSGCLCKKLQLHLLTYFHI